MSNKGKLIVIDALDGAGKETQTELLSEHLYNVGVDFQTISFPNYKSESSFGVQQLLQGNTGYMNTYATSVLYSNDRILSMTNPNTLEGNRSLIDYYVDGGLIVCDRYTSSNILYQTIDMDEQQTKEYIRWIEDLEYYKMGLPKPDGIIFLDVEPEVSMKNITSRGKGHDEYETLERLTKVYNGYTKLLKVGYNMHVIKCTEDGEMKSREEISKLIIEKVEEIYGDCEGK